MPLSALAAAAISAGTQVGTAGINAATSRSQQNNAYDLSMKQYERQRSDALADRAFENEYNSPAAQMARLKAGGLNPHLIYGNGTSSMQSVNTQQAKPGNPPQSEPFHLDLSSIVPLMLQTMQTNAQTDLLKQQAETQRAIALLTESKNDTEYWNQANQQEENQKRRRENYIGDANAQTDIAFRKKMLEKLTADTTYTLDQNERAEVLKNNTVAQTVSNILTQKIQRAKTREEIKNLTQIRDNLFQDERIKKYEEELNKTGLTKSDPMIFRVYEKILEMITK